MSRVNFYAARSDRLHGRQYCTQMVGTYNGKFNKEGPAKGDKSYGGYANYNRLVAARGRRSVLIQPQVPRQVCLQNPRRTGPRPRGSDAL